LSEENYGPDGLSALIEEGEDTDGDGKNCIAEARDVTSLAVNRETGINKNIVFPFANKNTRNLATANSQSKNLILQSLAL
jgi:hypothetical protein